MSDNVDSLDSLDSLDYPAAAAVERAAEVVAGASALLVCAGAGMGVDSGLPDFRGDDGFWRAYPPYARLGLRFVELADPAHFAADPELAWGFYGHRLELYRTTVPHAGFDVLRRLGERLPGGVGVFTSNVDGQFQRAGFTRVAEVHGSLHHLQCARPCTPRIWSADAVDVTVDPATMRAVPPLPRCPRCGDVVRPNVLMFGDWNWVSSRSDNALDALSTWLGPLRSDVAVVELGAGTSVPTVRRFTESVGRISGRLVRVNPREAEVPRGDGVAVPLGALAALTAIEACLQKDLARDE